MIDKNGYYSMKALLGYNAKYNIVLSDRGRGKSFGCKHFLMAQEGTSMCLFRTTYDMKAAMMSWIDPLVSTRKDTGKYSVYQAEDFAWTGSDKEGFVLKYLDEPKIWFRTLTQVNNIKQEVFPDDMNWVWLDEFIPLAYKKLPGVESEGDAIRTIIKTIEHDSVCSRKERGLKEVRMLMFANPFTWNNPILSYFKLTPKEGIHRIGPGVVMEMIPPLKKKRGKMTADDFLGNEVNANQGWYEEMAFVEVDWIGKQMIPVISIRLGGQYFMLNHAEGGGGTFYVEKMKGHRSTGGKVTYDRWGTLDGLKEGETCLDNTEFLKGLKERIRKGYVRYKDMNTKFDFQNGISAVR